MSAVTVTSSPHTPRRIRSVLVANRGEIAVRVCRTLTRLGIRSVAVHTPADAGALHVGTADAAVEIGSYLDADAIVAAATCAGADAVHPGYGFLSEDPGFARAVEAAGLVWIGPPASAIEAMGDKIRARETVARAGVPVVPGVGAAGMRDADLVEAAVATGLPVLLKPAAGGGGKGMRRVTSPEELPAAIEAARREAEGAFGDGTLLVERWVSRPRHIEVQVFADAFGGAVHLGERECSLQRRHQKIVEESPSPFVDAAVREAMTRSALDVARAVGYVGAGTVEFIVSSDRPDGYFFMEMNTRLQVEHPVTEAVTGLDLVEWQVRVAEGEPLPLEQSGVRFVGHAVEARVYAEDPARGFLPTGGTVAAVHEPAGRPGVRVDSSIAPGTFVGSRYDPMLAKVIAHGSTRDEALARLRGALAETTVLGVTTNVPYLMELLGHRDVVAGRLDTELVERTAGDLAVRAGSAGQGEPTGDEAAVVAAATLVAGRSTTGPFTDPWDVVDGWRLAGQGEWALRLRRDGPGDGAPGRAVRVGILGRLAGPATGVGAATVQLDAGAPMPVTVRPVGEGGLLEVALDGVTSRWLVAVAGADVWVGRRGRAWRFWPERVARGEGGVGGAGPGRLSSPMPGVVAAVKVAPGDEVRTGQVLVVVEAMKMEHAVAATRDGVVEAVLVRPGQVVGLDEGLVEVA